MHLPFRRLCGWFFRHFLIVSFAVGCTQQSTANDGVKESADLSQMIANARSGQHIVLPAGTHGLVRIENRKWERPVVVDARLSRIRLVLNDVENLHIIGGTFADANGTGPQGYAAAVTRSRGITIEDALFTNATRGLVIGRSEDIVLKRLTLKGLRSDGINLALSRRIQLSDIHCSEFSPVPPDHPDCIQAWSRPDMPPTADIAIQNVVVKGRMQGVFFGNHTRNGVDDGGFDRISIRGADVATTYLNAVAVFDCRNCTIVGNVVASLPESSNRALVRVKRCSDCTVADNLDEARPPRPATRSSEGKRR